jgi:hypothetical protein
LRSGCNGDRRMVYAVATRDRTPNSDKSHSITLDAENTEGKKAIVDTSGMLVKMI